MSLWVPVIAALGASLLTAMSTWVLDAMRRRHASRVSARDARRAAYVTLLHAANGTLLLGQTARMLLISESTPAVPLATMLRLRQPLDTVELAWRFAEHTRPILDAQVVVAACGSPRAVDASAAVANAVTAYVQAIASMTPLQRALRGVVPWRPTAAQNATAARRLEAASQAVSSFVRIMREELGEEAVGFGPPTANRRAEREGGS